MDLELACDPELAPGIIQVVRNSLKNTRERLKEVEGKVKELEVLKTEQETSFQAIVEELQEVKVAKKDLERDVSRLKQEKSDLVHEKDDLLRKTELEKERRRLIVETYQEPSEVNHPEAASGSNSVQSNVPITNAKLPPTAPRAHKSSSVQPQGATQEADFRNMEHRMVQEESTQAATAEKLIASTKAYSILKEHFDRLSDTSKEQDKQFSKLRSAFEQTMAEKNGLLVGKQKIEGDLVTKIKRLEAELKAEVEKRGILLTERTEQTMRAASEAKNELSQRITQLGEENAKLLTEIAKYNDATETVKTENTYLRDVVKGLEEECNNLRGNCKKIEAESATLKEDAVKMRIEMVSANAQVEEQMTQLTGENALLKTKIAAMRAEVESLASPGSNVAQLKPKSSLVKDEPREHQLQTSSNVIHTQEDSEIEELREDLRFAIERLNAAEKRAGMYKQKYHEVVPELTALRNAASATGSASPMTKDGRSQQAQQVVPALAHIQLDQTHPTSQNSEPISTISSEAPSTNLSCVSSAAESGASDNVASSLSLPPPTIATTKAIQASIPVHSNPLTSTSTSTSQSPPDLNLESDVDMEQSPVWEEELMDTFPPAPTVQSMDPVSPQLIEPRQTISIASIQELCKSSAHHQVVEDEDRSEHRNGMSLLSVHEVLTSVSCLPGQKYQMVPVAYKADNLWERLLKVTSREQISRGLPLFLPGQLLKAGEHYVAVDPATQIIPNTQHYIKSQLEDYIGQTRCLFVLEGEFIYYAGTYKCFKIAQMPVEGFLFSDFEFDSLGLPVLANTCIPKPSVPGFPGDQMVKDWIMNGTIRLNCIGLQYVGFEGELSRSLSSYHQQDVSARKRKREGERVREDERERRRMSRSRSPIPPSRRPITFLPRDRSPSGDTTSNPNRQPNEKRTRGDELDRWFWPRSRSPPRSPPQHRLSRRQSPKPSLFLRLKDEPRWRYRN